MNGHQMIKFRPQGKDDIQLFNQGQFLEFGRDLVTALCARLDVVLQDIDMASMIYGIDVPLDWCMDVPDLTVAQMRKIETTR